MHSCAVVIIYVLNVISTSINVFFTTSRSIIISYCTHNTHILRWYCLVTFFLFSQLCSIAKHNNRLLQQTLGVTTSKSSALTLTCCAVLCCAVRFQLCVPQVLQVLQSLSSAPNLRAVVMRLMTELWKKQVR